MAGTVKVLNPQTGKVEELPAEEAQAHYIAGKRQLLKGDTVSLRGPDGTVADFDSAKVQGAVDAGWGFASKDDVLRADAQNQQVQAFAEAAGSPLTFGLSDLALRQAGVEGLKERRETDAGALGNAAGIGASLLAPVPGLGAAGSAAGEAGKGIARSALDAALMPTIAVNAAGHAIEGAAGKALAGLVENEAVRSAAAAGIGRAVEGAAFGAGAQLSEEALGNPDMNSESILAAMGAGGLLGGVTGGVLGAGLRGLTDWRAGAGAAKASRRATPLAPSVEELEAGLKATGVDVEAGNPMVKKFWQTIREDLPEALGGYNKADIQRVNSPRAQAYLREGKQVLEESGRDLKKVVDQMAEFQGEASSNVYGKLRPQALDAMIPKGAENETLRGVASQMDQARSALLSVAENEAAWGLGEGGGQKLVKNYLTALDDAEARIFRKAGVSRQIEERIQVEDPLFHREDAVYNRQLANARVERGTEQVAAAEQKTLEHVLAEAPAGERIRIADIQAKLPNVSKKEINAALSKYEQEKKLVAYKIDDANDWTAADKANEYLVAGNPRHVVYKQAGAEFPLPAPTTTARETDRLVLGDRAAAEKGLPTGPRVRTEISTRTRDLTELAEKYSLPHGVAREAFDALENVKRLLAKPGRFGDDIADAGNREVQKQFQQAYGVLRNGLEDTTVWGEAGAVNKEINEAFHARMNAWKDLKRQLKFNGDEVDPASIATYLSKVDKLKGDGAAEALDAWHAAQKRFADVADKHFQGSGIGTKTNKLLGEFAGVRKNLEDKVGVFNALNRLTSRRNQVFGFGGGGGFAAGAVMGGLGFLPAGVAGVIGQNIIDPGRAALMRANMAGVRDRVGQYIGKRAESLVTGVKSALPSLPTTQRALTKATTAMLSAKTPEDRRAAYQERLAELQTMQDPQIFGDHAAQQLAGITDHAPAHADSMTRTGALAIALLQASLPGARPGTVGDGTLFDQMHSEPVPHDRDILKFAQVDQAAQDPLSILDAAEKGYVFRHQVETVEKLYPNLMQSVRTSITAAGGNLKGKIPAIRSRALSQLLGGVAVPPAKLAQMQAVHHMPEVAPPPPRSPSSKTSRSSSMLTSVDKLDTYPFGSH